VNLEKLLCSQERARKLSLTEEERKRVLTDLLRWTARSGGDRILRTADGEPYHSVSAGALTECLHKFLIPSGLLSRKKGEIRILDVGFGLGYNLAVAIHHLRERNPTVEIEVVALDRKLPEPVILLPPPYAETHRKVLSLLPEGEREGIRVRLLTGDARRTLTSVSDFGADAVFHDAFSPYRNAELWTLEFLRKIRNRMDPHGVWVSYTSSLAVRKALVNLGFRIGCSAPVGRRKGGTVALLKGFPPPLSDEEKLKLERSPYSIPFRDETLSRDPGKEPPLIPSSGWSPPDSR